MLYIYIYIYHHKRAKNNLTFSRIGKGERAGGGDHRARARALFPSGKCRKFEPPSHRSRRVIQTRPVKFDTAIACIYIYNDDTKIVGKNSNVRLSEPVGASPTRTPLTAANAADALSRSSSCNREQSRPRDPIVISRRNSYRNGGSIIASVYSEVAFRDCGPGFRIITLSRPTLLPEIND